jgi:LuxR family maltose regulon positive regulatory protein
MVPVMNWLESLPAELMDTRPSLWVAYASTLTIVGKPVEDIEKILRSAEEALQNTEQDEENQDLIGQIAAIRAMLAIPQNQIETIIEQSRRALEYLHPENLSVRTTTTWTLGYAYQLQGDRIAALQAHTQALSIGQKSGNIMISIAAATSLGQILESENQLHQAVERYKSVLQMAGDPPLPAACEAHLGLARISYQWNDLGAAQKHGEKSLQLAQKMENVDTPADCELLFARLKLAQGDVDGARGNLANAGQLMQKNNFTHLMPDVAVLHVLVSLREGNFERAAEVAEKHKLPLGRAWVYLARGDAHAALAVLESYSQQMEAQGLKDERLKAMILLSVAHHAHGTQEQALSVLKEALALAEQGGFIRIFVDEGALMADLLSKAAAQGILPSYIHKLLMAFEAEDKSEDKSIGVPAPPLIEPLSERELEILQLIAQGLSNREIGKRLFLALNTVKGHNRRIFNKLQVQRRTEAVARARELKLL